MTKYDVIVRMGKDKKSKGPSKELKDHNRNPIKVSQEELDEVNGYIVEGVFRLKPKDNHNRLLLQVNWYLANNNEYKARYILRTLGLTNKKIKAYIDDEKSLQRREPELSNYIKFYNHPMPIEFKVKGN